MNLPSLDQVGLSPPFPTARSATTPPGPKTASSSTLTRRSRPTPPSIASASRTNTSSALPASKASNAPTWITGSVSRRMVHPWSRAGFRAPRSIPGTGWPRSANRGGRRSVHSRRPCPASQQTSRGRNQLNSLVSIFWTLFVGIGRRVQRDELDLERHPRQIQPRHGDRQPEPPPPGASWIDVQHARPFAAGRLVRMPRDHYAEPSRRRIEVQFVQIVQHVDECVASFGDGSHGQRLRPPAVVDIASDSYHRRHRPERCEDFGRAYVTGVDDQVRPRQRLHRFRAKQAVCVRDQANYQHFIGRVRAPPARPPPPGPPPTWSWIRR